LREIVMRVIERIDGAVPEPAKHAYLSMSPPKFSWNALWVAERRRRPQ
jgi:hypothetical protein